MQEDYGSSSRLEREGGLSSQNFCFWLQGYFEIAGRGKFGLNERQVELLQKHLNLVFKHEIDPAMGDTEHQEELNDIHSSSLTSSDPQIRC